MSVLHSSFKEESPIPEEKTEAGQSIRAHRVLSTLLSSLPLLFSFRDVGVAGLAPSPAHFSLAMIEAAAAAAAAAAGKGRSSRWEAWPEDEDVALSCCGAGQQHHARRESCSWGQSRLSRSAFPGSVGVAVKGRKREGEEAGQQLPHSDGEGDVRLVGVAVKGRKREGEEAGQQLPHSDGGDGVRLVGVAVRTGQQLHGILGGVEREEPCLRRQRDFSAKSLAVRRRTDTRRSLRDTRLFLLMLALVGVAGAWQEDDRDPEQGLVAISGSFSHVDEKEDKSQDKMLADSPFSDKLFEISHPYRRVNPKFMPPPASLPSSSFFSKTDSEMEWEYNRFKFVQIYSSLSMTNLIVESDGGSVTSSDSLLDANAFFQISRLHGSYSQLIEHVRSCSFLCMNKDGSLYMSKRPWDEPACTFRTTPASTAWEEEKGLESSSLASVATLNVIVSAAFSNDSHSLILSLVNEDAAATAAATAAADVAGEEDGVAASFAGQLVRRGTESPRHQFLLPRVAYADMKTALGAEVAANIYLPVVRYQAYCPMLPEKNRTDEKTPSASKEKDDTKKKKKKEEKKNGRLKCSGVADMAQRRQCRDRKLERCRSRRQKKRLTSDEHPCTVQERRRRRRQRRLRERHRNVTSDRKKSSSPSPSPSASPPSSSASSSLPWNAENCDSITTSRVDRRICKRQKRQRCRQRLRSEKGGSKRSKNKIAEMCRDEQWLRTCVHIHAISSKRSASGSSSSSNNNRVSSTVTLAHCKRKLKQKRKARRRKKKF